MPKPVVAAVRGMAAGAGAGLAFLADFRIGGPSTGFLMAFANVGLAGDTGRVLVAAPAGRATPRPPNCCCWPSRSTPPRRTGWAC